MGRELTERAERRFIIDIMTNLIKTNIELMKYHKRIAKDKHGRNVCQRSIDNSEQSLIKLPKIKHIEILRSIYKTAIVGKESIFVVGGAIANFEKVQEWDSEEGFPAFLELEQKGQKMEQEEMERKIEYQQAIEKAQKEGKEVEFVYDKDTGVAKPVILDTKENA